MDEAGVSHGVKQREAAPQSVEDSNVDSNGGGWWAAPLSRCLRLSLKTQASRSAARESNGTPGFTRLLYFY